MFRITSKSGLAAAIAIAGCSLFTSPASAQDVELRIGPDGLRPVVRDRDRGCSPGEARAAARDEGLRQPEVIRATSRSITVEGMTRYGVDRMTFANRRGCPAI
jgi:hypothetical protein